MSFEEHPIAFACNGDTLYGILSVPEQPASHAVLIVVGGPQYRAGSHRQFVLLAREFASHGYPVLRFDYRGMGDSEGEPRDFEHVDDDLRAAIDQLFEAVPSVRDVVIFGLCDGASAAVFYAHQDTRVSGLVLVNPWGRTEEGEAKTRLKHYYQMRMLDAGLWKKIARGDFDLGTAAKSLWASVGKAYRNPAANDLDALPSLPERLYEGLNRFVGPVLIVLSGNDLTAREFDDLMQSDRKWRALVESKRIRHIGIAGANHTFSRREWRKSVSGMTLALIEETLPRAVSNFVENRIEA